MSTSPGGGERPATGETGGDEFDGAACGRHPESEANHRCDGCGSLLCDECVEVGHRLRFCRLCGERAIPLAPSAPEVPEPRRIEPGEIPPWSDALAYPFRGRQAIFVAGLSGLLVGLAVVEAAAPEAGCLLALPKLLLVALVPAIMGDVVRTTAAGIADLPEWPPMDVDRLVELFAFGVAGLMALLPATVLFSFTGCSGRFARRLVLAARSDASPESLLLGFGCFLVLVVGLWLGALWWVPCYGASAAFGSIVPTVSIRPHLRFFREAPREIIVVGTAAGAILGIGLLLFHGLPSLIVAGIVQAATFSWGAVATARLVGLLFLRYSDRAEAIYGDHLSWARG